MSAGTGAALPVNAPEILVTPRGRTGEYTETVSEAGAMMKSRRVQPSWPRPREYYIVHEGDRGWKIGDLVRIRNKRTRRNLGTWEVIPWRNGSFVAWDLDDEGDAGE